MNIQDINGDIFETLLSPWKCSIMVSVNRCNICSSALVSNDHIFVFVVASKELDWWTQISLYVHLSYGIEVLLNVLSVCGLCWLIALIWGYQNRVGLETEAKKAILNKEAESWVTLACASIINKSFVFNCNTLLCWLWTETTL